MIAKTLEVFTSVGWVCTFGHTPWTRYFQKIHMWYLRGLDCTIVFNKLKSYEHRYRLDFFYKMGMGNMYQNWWCPGDLNPSMCIEKYDHNSYGFQAKKRKNTHYFMKYSHTIYKSHDTNCSLRLSNTTSKSYLFNNWILIMKFITK
jgi:hypothetical protein